MIFLDRLLIGEMYRPSFASGTLDGLRRISALTFAGSWVALDGQVQLADTRPKYWAGSAHCSTNEKDFTVKTLDVNSSPRLGLSKKFPCPSS